MPGLNRNSSFPDSQLTVPPVILHTATPTLVSGSEHYDPPLKKVDFRDSQGNGVPFSNGLVMFVLGTNNQTSIMIEIRVTAFRNKGWFGQ